MVDKPEGITSHDVVAVARRMLRQSRIGHTGTLDPFATGVLPLACGKATRLARFMSASVKTYEATVRFGLVTDTYDITGTEVARSDRRPSEGSVTEALALMQGEQMQTPPPYSAKRVDGQRAYDLARRQTPVVLPAARVRLDTLDVLSLSPDAAVLRLSCSAGYYVRSFAHDLGARLGTGACLAALRRTASGPFTLDGSATLTDLDGGRGAEMVLPLARLLPEFRGVIVSPTGRDRLQHGQMLRPVDVIATISGTGTGLGEVPLPDDEWVRVLDDQGALVGVGRPWDPDGTLRPAIVLI